MLNNATINMPKTEIIKNAELVIRYALGFFKNMKNNKTEIISAGLPKHNKNRGREALSSAA